MYKITALMANVALIAPLLGPLVGAAWVHVLPWEDVYFICRTGRYRLFRATARNAGDRHAAGETLSFKALGRDYRLVIKIGGSSQGVSAGICQPAAVGTDCAVADYHH